jgi:hypothetical protein
MRPILICCFKNSDLARRQRSDCSIDQKDFAKKSSTETNRNRSWPWADCSSGVASLFAYKSRMWLYKSCRSTDLACVLRIVNRETKTRDVFNRALCPVSQNSLRPLLRGEFPCRRCQRLDGGYNGSLVPTDATGDNVSICSTLLRGRYLEIQTHDFDGNRFPFH